MKKVFSILATMLLILSCDDGEIIVTTFDFENVNLQSCQTNDGVVFFSINDGALESIALDLTIAEEDFLIEGTQDYQIGSTSNVVDYRIFNETVSSSYFCNSIPPTTPSVSINYTSSSGVAQLTNTVLLDDNDGLGTEIEGDDTDTDEDGIPDFYDFDDDGDNVPTGVEIGADVNNPRDTDGDGTPDYLDIDDDGDGVFTINEDLNMDLDPTNDISDNSIGPDYLNPNVSIETTINTYREHSYSVNTSTALFIEDLVLVGEGEEITQESLDLGEIIDILTGTITITPEF
ncbi:hypothetical protein [Patiriisocius hiemis]|uniref:Calcium-binding protein n=1 Tax=Patiriisocius hiemis TaxID=3075604 RepID=A0ABU2YAX1_9FLAO|nr:hypothetical protein [Constantimarinum sp. W242]MDT0554996.1 hypothetical protein [Constantimarinum sp. W242]